MKQKWNFRTLDGDAVGVAAFTLLLAAIVAVLVFA